MNVEFLQACGQLIERFGFPIFFGLVALFFLFIIIRYFIKTIECKDQDFFFFFQKRDAEFSIMAKQHSESFDKNTLAIRENTSATHTLIAIVTGKKSREMNARTRKIDIAQ